MKKYRYLFLVSALLIVLYLSAAAVYAETTYTWKNVGGLSSATKENGFLIMHKNFDTTHADGETNYADVYFALEIPPASFPADQDLSLKLKVYGTVLRNDMGRGIYADCKIKVAEPDLDWDSTLNAGDSMTPDDYNALSWGNFTTGGFSDRETVVTRYMSQSGYEEGDVLSIYLRTSFGLSELKYKLEKTESDDGEESGGSTPDTDYVVKGNFVYAVKNNKASFFYRNNENLTKITVPSTIKYKGKSIPVTEIYWAAFKGMKKLKTVVIGKNVTTIGKNAFEKCVSLNTVSGGKSLVSIGDSAFSGCKNLAEFTFCSKVKTIGKNAFLNCKKLKKITFKTKKLTSKTVAGGAFKNIYKKAAVTVPKGKKTAYQKLLIKKGLPKTAKIK